MTDAQVATSLDLRGKTTTTFILYEVNHALQELGELGFALGAAQPSANT